MEFEATKYEEVQISMKSGKQIKALAPGGILFLNDVRCTQWYAIIKTLELKDLIVMIQEIDTITEV